MRRRHLRVSAPLAVLVAVSMLATPPVAAAPQNLCDGPFCASVEITTFDAGAPTQPTTAAGQPVNLSLHVTDTSSTVATDPARWLAEVIVRPGTSSAKTMAVADPASLPLGSYLAGSSAPAASWTPGLDGSGYATSCPAGYGTGHVQLTPIIPGSPTIAPFSFGVQSVTTGLNGAVAANLSIWIPGTTLLFPITATTPITFNPATANAGPKLELSVKLDLQPPPYASSPASLNDLTLTLNGLVTEAATGPVSPAVPFLRHSLVCTDVTSSVQVNARGTQSVLAPVTQTINGCPTAPQLTSVAPVPGQPLAVTFAAAPPVAAVPGRTASIEWVFGDGAKALTGATTTHTYPTSNAVLALATVVDSAGVRSTTVQVRIAGSRLRVKQAAGNRITGELADQDTGQGVAGQQVDAYACPSRNAPLTQCKPLGTGVTRTSGSYRIRIPEVTKKGTVVVAYAGTASKSATQPARFGAQRSLTVLPQPDITLKVSEKRVHPGATVRLSGKVTPGKKGKTVRLQGFIRGAWRSIGRATVSQRGTYAASYVVRVPKQPKVKVRAFLPGTAATFEATSPVKVLRIQR